MADSLDQQTQQLIRTIMNVNTRFTSLDSAIDNFNRATNKELTEYEKQLDKKGTLNKEETEIIKQHLKTLKAMEIDKKKELEQHKEDAQKVTEANKRELAEKQNQLAILQTQSKAYMDLDSGLNAKIANLQKEIEGHETHERKINEELRKAEQALEDITNEIKAQESKMSVAQKVLGNTIQGLGSVIDSGIRYIFNPARLQKAGSDAIDSIQAEINTGMGLSARQFWHTASLGLSPKEFTDAMAKYRGAALAAGGLDKTTQILDKTQGEYEDTIATLADRTEFAFKQMDTFRRAGIKPLASDTALLRNSFKHLQTMTGMTGPQFQDMMAEMQSDQATMQKLQATTSEAERRAILTNIAKRVEENVAMGMTIEQAKAATKTLNKLAGQGPLERLKQAAKLRAFGGAMGIAGSDEAAKALIAGQRATKEQQDSLQKFLTSSSNALSQSAMGSMGGEIFATTLSDKLGLTQLIGPGSDFNTVLTQSLAGDMRKAAAALEPVGPTLVKANEIYEVIRNQLNGNNVILSGILGAVGVIIALMGKNAIGKGIADKITDKLGKKLEERAAQAAVRTAGSAAPELAAAAEGAVAEAAPAAAAEVAGTAAAGLSAATIGAVAAAVAASGTALYAGYKAAKGEDASNFISEFGGHSVRDWLETNVMGVRQEAGSAPMELHLSEKAKATIAAREAQAASNKSAEVTATTNVAMATDISQQVKQLTQSNEYLKQILESSETSNDLAGRMLVALTMSDEKRAKEADRLLTGNKFATQYASVG